MSHKLMERRSEQALVQLVFMDLCGVPVPGLGRTELENSCTERDVGKR